MANYLVEVRVTLPQGNTIHEWGKVGDFFEDVRTELMGVDLMRVSHRISKAIKQYEEKQ